MEGEMNDRAKWGEPAEIRFVSLGSTFLFWMNEAEESWEVLVAANREPVVSGCASIGMAIDLFIEAQLRIFGARAEGAVQEEVRRLREERRVLHAKYNPFYGGDI